MGAIPSMGSQPVAVAPASQEKRRPTVKNKKVLSFEASGSEDEGDKFGKAQSAHDVLDDPKLSKSTGSRPARAAGDANRLEKASAAGTAAKSPVPERRQKEAEPERRAKPPPRAPKPSSGSGSEDSDSEDSDSGYEDGVAGDVAAARFAKRQAEIAQLKKQIAAVGKVEEGPAQQKKARCSALEARLEGYVTRKKTKPEGRKGKKEAEDNTLNKLKSFRKRLVAANEDAAEADEAEDVEQFPSFSAIWQEGEETTSGNWLTSQGLRFHVSADKAFKVEIQKGRKQLQIFDPLAAQGDADILAAERQKRLATSGPNVKRRKETAAGQLDQPMKPQG